MATIDPVRQASAYQQMLLSLLADEDPATVQAETEGHARELLAAAGSSLATRPAPHEWSVLELLGHLLDAEIVVSGRYRWILSHDRPSLPAYDQDLWVQRLHGEGEDPDDLLAAFGALRSANLALWKRTTGAERERVGLHVERGPESYEMTFRLLAGHDRFHLEQMRRTLSQLSAPEDQASCVSSPSGAKT
jgi:hypothetical protein